MPKYEKHVHLEAYTFIMQPLFSIVIVGLKHNKTFKFKYFATHVVYLR